MIFTKRSLTSVYLQRKKHERSQRISHRKFWPTPLYWFSIYWTNRSIGLGLSFIHQVISVMSQTVQVHVVAFQQEFQGKMTHEASKKIVEKRKFFFHLKLVFLFQCPPCFWITFDAFLFEFFSKRLVLTLRKPHVYRHAGFCGNWKKAKVEKLKWKWYTLVWMLCRCCVVNLYTHYTASNPSIQTIHDIVDVDVRIQ